MARTHAPDAVIAPRRAMLLFMEPSADVHPELALSGRIRPAAFSEVGGWWRPETSGKDLQYSTAPARQVPTG